MSTAASGMTSSTVRAGIGPSRLPTAVGKSPAPVGTEEHDRAMTTPAHLAPRNCFICGGAAHADTDHTFWSNDAALTEAREHDRLTVHRYPGGETSQAAAYVAEHRPY